MPNRPSDKPIYRDDIKGKVKETKQECAEQIANAIANSDEFIMMVEDTGAWWDYADTLTEKEIRECWRKAAHKD